MRPIKRIVNNIMIILLHIVSVILLIGLWGCTSNNQITKEERINNMLVYSGTQVLSNTDYADEIQAALSGKINWDSLFLSDSFKKKFKDRKHILGDVRSIVDVWIGIDYAHDDNEVLVYVEQNDGIFDRDDTDDITSKYRLKYILDDNGEIDDLVILDRQEISTMTGEPVGD